MQSSLFPVLALQPRSWVANPMLAGPSDYGAATLQVHRSDEHGSLVRFGVLEPQEAPFSR